VPAVKGEAGEAGEAAPPPKVSLGDGDPNPGDFMRDADEMDWREEQEP
jgi:hypothetical protein